MTKHIKVLSPVDYILKDYFNNSSRPSKNEKEGPTVTFNNFYSPPP